MLVLLSKIMLGVSFAGVVLVIAKTIPVLAELPESSAPVLTNSLRRGAKRMAPDFSGFSLEKFWHKVLSKSKVFILRIERKINSQLRKLRKDNKPKKKKDFNDDEYWDGLKKEVEDEEND